VEYIVKVTESGEAPSTADCRKSQRHGWDFIRTRVPLRALNCDCLDQLQSVYVIIIACNGTNKHFPFVKPMIVQAPHLCTPGRSESPFRWLEHGWIGLGTWQYEVQEITNAGHACIDAQEHRNGVPDRIPLSNRFLGRCCPCQATMIGSKTKVLGPSPQSGKASRMDRSIFDRLNGHMKESDLSPPFD
jgi:hypothetical protein